MTDNRESQVEPVNPPVRRGPGIVRSGIRAEVRATLALATPLAVANLAQMAMGVTNTVMVGRLGAVPLAAAGLGGMLFLPAVGEYEVRTPRFDDFQPGDRLTGICGRMRSLIDDPCKRP